MAKSLNALASQILANCSSNQNLRIDLNREHVYDAICQTKAAIIRQWLTAGKQVAMPPFCFPIPRLDVQLADFSNGGLLLGEHVYQDPEQIAPGFGLPTSQLRQYVRLPQLMNWGSMLGVGKPAIDYLGPVNGAEKLDIYVGDSYRYASYRKYTGRRPFAYINDNVAWLFAPQALPWPQLTLRAVLADVREGAEFGRVFDLNETPFPCPDDFADEIVKQLTNRYISMYGRHSIPRPSDGNLPPL